MRWPVGPPERDEERTAASGRARDALAAASLLALAAWLLRAGLFGGQVFYARDIHLVWYAQVEAFVRAVAAGSWPLWDRSLSFGQPLLANPNAQVLYPPAWLNLVLRPSTVYAILLVSHLLFSALGLYALARRLGVSRAGATTASALWASSGPLLSLGTVWHHFMGAAWLPWAFLAGEAALASQRTRAAVGWGAVVGLQMLAGSPDMSILTGVGLLALVVKSLDWTRPASRTNRTRLLIAAGAAAFAVVLAAGQWLPSLQAALGSSRRSLPSEIRSYWSVHPLELVTALVPGLWGGLPLTPEWVARLYESREPFMPSLYLGAAALPLVTAVIVGPRRPWRGLLSALAIFGILFALGQHSPIHSIAAQLWPPLRMLRYPVKSMVLVAFAWSLLAGMGFDAWRRPTPPGHRRAVAALLVPGASLWLTVLAGLVLAHLRAPFWWTFVGVPGPGTPDPLAHLVRRLALAAVVTGVALGLTIAHVRLRPRPSLAAALALLAVADLAVYHRNLQPVAPPTLFTHRPEVLDAVAEADSRLYVYDYTVVARNQRYGGRPSPFELARAPGGWTLEQAYALGMQMALVPLSGGRWGLLGSFEVDYLGLYPGPLALLSELVRHVEETPGHLRLLRRTGVTHVVALHDKGLGDLIPATTVPGLFVQPIRVYRVPQPLRRAYAVGTVRVSDDAEAARLLLDPAFDPTREVILSEGRAAEAPRPFTSTIWSAEWRPDRVVIDAELSADGHLVLLESYDAGWRAWVDGRPAPVHRANLAFRGVPVPAGRHRIELLYRPTVVTVGMGLTAAAVAAGVLLAIRRRPT